MASKIGAAVLLALASAASAQNHAQPWHDPYVGQLVTCRPDPTRAGFMLGAYTFAGDDLHDFTFKRDPKGCPLRIEIEPRPQGLATGAPRASAPKAASR